VSRREKDRIVKAIVEKYNGRIGAAVVSDDACLSRLLSTLQLDRADGDVGEYLCSFLVA